MASIVSVEQLKGLASGSTPNTITVPTGQKIVGTDAGSIYSPESILQTASSGAFTATVTVTSTSFISMGHTCSITAKASNSRFLVRLSGGGWYDNANSNQALWLTFYKSVNGGAYSNLANVNTTYGLLRMSGDGNTWNIKPYSAEWLDPTTDSAGAVITYAVYARVNGPNSSQYNSSDRGTPVLMVQEIAQ